MPKQENATPSGTIRVTLSEQSISLLGEIAAKGIYGRNVAEVAGRFVDHALQGFVEPTRLEIRSKGSTRRGR